MRRSLPTPLAFAIAALVSLASASAAEFSLSGTVVDQVTGAPVRHARVSLRPTGDQVDSDAAGAFQFSHLAAGTYTVAAAKTGFEDNGVYVELAASRTGLVIQLTPLATIRGQIADDDGEPVEGVVVLALRSQVEQGFRHPIRPPLGAAPCTRTWAKRPESGLRAP